MKTDKKRSFRGAVLLTVVSVMSLLIIFLTSTLALATAANNRAHKSYASSQANYTARTAVDSVLEAVHLDESFANAVKSVNSTNPSLTVNITMDSDSAGMGKITDATVKYEGTKKYFNTSEKKWTDHDILSITATVLYAGETKTVTSYIMKDPPVTVTSSGGGGGFVTVGSAALGNHTNSFGGTYLGVGMGGANRFYAGTHPVLGEVGLDQRLYLNVPDGTPMETLSNGKEGYDIYNDANKDKNQSTLVPVFQSDSPQAFEAPTVINGNYYLSNKAELIFPIKGTGMAIWGNMSIGNSFTVSSENVNVSNNLIGADDETKKRAIEKFSEIPYIFIDGELTLRDHAVLGDNTLPLNLFIGRLNPITDNASEIYGNVYCQDENETSVLKGNGGGTKLYKFSQSVIEQTDGNITDGVNGTFATKGSLIVNGIINIEGDLLVEHDLTIENGGKLTVGGNLVVGGTLNNENGEMNVNGYIAADSAMGNDISANTGAKKMKSDNSGELYEQHDEVYHCVLAKNVKIQENPWYAKPLNYAWLSNDAIAAFGLVDADGDGIIDEKIHDFGWATIDSSLLQREEWGSIDESNPPDETYTETTWINLEDGTVTSNENDTFEISGYTYNHNGSKVIDPTSLYRDMHNGEIYPRKAEKAVILGLEEIGDGTPISDSKILKTVNEIEDEYKFEQSAVTSIPADDTDATKLVTDKNRYTDPDSNSFSDFNIKGDCTLSGYFNHKDIVIEAQNSDTWVRLESGFNLGNGARIVYDDTKGSGELKLFIEGNVNTSADGSSIITKSYDQALFHSTDAYQINTYDDVKKVDGATDLAYPRITIYSRIPNDGEASPSLKLGNNAIVTASIEAPYLEFDINDAKGNVTAQEIYYNGKGLLHTNIAEGATERIGVIGTLNVAEVTGVTDNWDFLYVPKNTSGTGTPVTSADGSGTKYVITYYEGF